MNERIGVWFPTIRAGTGADVYTERLVDALHKRGIRAEIAWLPKHVEYFPWFSQVPKTPSWATVVHINSWLHRRFIPKNLPVVVTVHSWVHDPALVPYKGMVQKIYHRWWVWRRENYAIARADAVSAVSTYTANMVEGAFSCGDVLPIYNWIDTDLFKPIQKTQPHKPFRLLFLGNPGRKLKGADLLPKIMRNLGMDFELRYTGMKSDFEISENLPENMVAIGRLESVDEIVSACQSCDALIFPTRLEGFGLVALEAQACGIPVVATDCTALPEVVTHNETGVLCRKDDVLMFVEAVRQLRNNPEVWRQMCQKARGRAEFVFSEKIALDKYICLYRDICRLN